MQAMCLLHAQTCLQQPAIPPLGLSAAIGWLLGKPRLCRGLEPVSIGWHLPATFKGHLHPPAGQLGREGAAESVDWGSI